MTIEEIIKRQKEHLTKAQISELIQATERYKQLNAANRASAMRTLSDQYRATRRGLQNTGLAGRKGKLISGQEKAARIRANEAYRGYNAGLRQIDNAYAQNRAARMANETARENQLAEIEKIQAENDKEAARINAEYEAWLRKKKAAEEALKRRQEEIERIRAQQQAQQQQIRERIEEDRAEQSGVVQGSRIQRLAKDKHPQLETSDYARAAQEQAVQRAVNEYQQTQKGFRQQREADAMYDAMHPGSAITRAPHTDDYVMEQKRVENARQLKVSGASDAEVWFADAYGVSPDRYMQVKRENPELIKSLTGAIQSIRANSDTWDAILNGEDESHQVKGIGTVRTKAYTAAEKNKARTEKASAYRALAIADAAMRIENESVRKLFVMDDAAFDVMYAAALQIYKIRVNQAENLPFDNDRVTGESTTATYNRLMAEAAEAFAPYEAAKRLKDESQEEAFIAETYGVDETLTPKRPDWLKGSIYSDGHENWVEAHNRGWSADDYEKKSDHRVGNYEALVNEWSFINGRTALLYTQNFQVTNDIANIGEWVGHAFGGDINRNEAYRSFRRKCESKMGVSSEKMDSLLTLSNLMTDEERAKYNTILRDGGAEEADKYFEYLYESVLPNRFEQFVENELASQTNTPEERLLQSIVSIPNNLIQGVSGTIHTMTTNVDDPVAARLDAKKYTTAQAMRGAVGSHYGEVGNFLYQGVMSMADSTTVALVGQGIGGILKGAGVASGLATKAGSVLGGSLLGATAYTSAYEEAIQRGLSPEKAKQTALANGINEMLFEAVSLDILVGHFQKGGILKVSKNGFVNWVVNTLVQGGVEGSEEVFTDIANRLWDNRINGVFSEELTAVRKYMMEDGLTYKQALQKVNDEFGAQLWESFKAGAFSGGVMGGGASFLGMAQNRGNEKVGKGLRQNSRVMNELRNFDFKSEYAQEILTQDKLTNQDVADLFNIRQQELLGQYKSDIQQAVADGKITQEQADLLKKYEQNGVQIVHDGEVVANENGITVEQMPSVQDAIANLDNAARIQFLNNEEMRSLVQAVGGETAAVIEQSETAEREAEKTYQQTVREINNDTTLSPELKQKRLEAAERTRQNARSEASKIADTALTNKKGIGAKLETDGNGTVKVGKGSGKVTYDFSTKDNPGHQTVDSMTATEQSALRIAKIVAASRPDVNVKVEAEFVGEHANENGYYDPKTNTIHINMSGDNSVLWTLSHELTHHLANTDTEAYAALRTAIETALKDSKLTTTELEDRGFEYDLEKVDPYIAREGNLWDALVAFEREEHGYGKDAEEEVVARCCESFLGFDQFVKDFARKQYKSAKAINKFIAQMNIDMQRVSEEARQSAAQRHVWNDESPENQILRQLTEIDKIANLWRIAVNAEAKKRQEIKRTARENTVEQTNGNRYSKVDSVLAKRLDSEEMVKVYRAMQVIDGKLYPPMAAKVKSEDGRTQLVEETKIGEWYQADERPDLIDPKTGKWKLNKGVGTPLDVAYNPYFHTSLSPLNDQFSSAYKRDNLVVVEGYVPKSELTSGYKAQYAKDSVGAMRWHSGTVSAKLKTPRTVILSRYFKANRIMSDAEVASVIKTMLKSEDPNISIPQKLVTPGLYKALNDAGVKTTPMDGVRASTKDSVKLSERFNTENEDSLNDKDSIGNVLSENQAEYFKDSKARNKDGNLMLFYHGTNADFTVFDRSKIGSTGRFEGSGFNFTPYEGRAKSYGKNVLTGYLNITNPLSADKKTLTVSKLARLIREVDPTGDNIIANYANDTRDYGSETFIRRESITAARNILQYSDNDVDVYSDISSADPDAEGLIAAFEKLGYDGVIHYDDNGNIKTVVVFSSNQFKNADNKNPTKNEDIRFSMKDNVERKESDAQYMDLARRYESGDKSVEAELRKAVDAAAKANGYVYGHAYHGTDYYKDITVFKRGKGGYLGSGIYFSDRQDTAKRYADRMGDGGKVYDAFLKIDNPLKVTSADPAQEILRAAYGNDRVYNERVRNQTNQSQFIQKKDITKLQSKGYDGIIWKLERGVETEYSVFDPEQIKSADLITKDDSGNIIPLSERFKTDRTGEDAWKNEDIRYSLKDDVKQTDITEYEHFNEEKYAKMSETERIEYREHIAEMQIRKEARERQRTIDRNRRIRRDLTAMLKRGNDRIVKMLANPTENSHVPVQLAQAVAEYAQRLNELLVADVNYVRDNPPSVEDVKAYIDKHGYNVDANRFVDFYTGRGWLANSGLPMTNWKLNVASWAKRGEPQNVSGRQKTGAEKIIDALNRSYADEETIAALKAEDPKFDPRGLLPVQYDENGHIVKDETLIKMINGMDSIIQGKHLSDLTEDELRFVMNTMRGAIHTVTEANKVTVQGEQRNVYRESRQMANEVNSATKVFGDKSNKITKFMNRYVIESLCLRRIAKLYSGSDENAVFVKMVDDLNAGALEQERIKQTLRGMFNEVTTKYAKEMDTWYGKNAEWIDTGFGFKITKGMRVSLAMHILNAQNLRNVEKAGLRIPDMAAYRKGNIKEAYKNGKVVRLTKAQAEQIVANMTEAEKAYYEVAKEFFHKRSGFYINRTSLKLLGYSKAIVENYFPIQTDDAYRTVKYDDVRQNASVEHPGFLESRNGTANVMYLNDITAVVNRQIDGVAKYAGLAIPMRNWNNIMNAWLFEENEDGEWVRSDKGRAHDVLERRMGYTGKGKAIIDYVDQFITDLTSPGIRDANENVHAAEFAAKITSNYVKAVLTLNLRVALSQMASVPTAAAEIPWKYLVQSFGGNVEGHLNRNASNDLIDQYTQIFAMRRAGTQTEVSEVMKRRGFADKAEQKLPGLLGWITGMDVAATRRLWYACERWVKGETDIPVGSDAFYKEVAKRYERVIQNTQPNFTVLQRSPALRSKSAAARIITMFGTQRMQNAGVFIESLAEVVQTKDKAKRKVAMKKFGRTLSGLITAAIVIGLERALVSALRGRMRPLQDEDKDITVGSVSKYIMGEIGTSLAGSFMYVGELYDFVHGVIGGLADGDSGYETSFALPAAEALSTVIEFFKNKDWQYFEYMRGDHTDHEKWLKTRSFVNELMTVASYATGLPLANASKTILNGAVPLVQDIVESTKTGELNLYLHQSGKLDSAKTAANYKEWTNLGKKGSVYLAWENRFKEDTSNGLDHRAELLFEDRELSADEKAILLRMSNSTKDNPLTSKYGVVYKDDGTVVVDFTNLDRYRASTMLSDKQYEGFLNLVDMGVAEDVASTAFIQYNVQKKQGSGANDRFRDWLFKTIKNPEDRAKVDMAVVGNTVRVEGTIGYKENGEVYADYSSKEMFDLYTSGKKQQKSDAIISTTDTPEAKAKAFADTDNDYHAKGGIVYNDKDKVVADFTSDEAYRASQMGESHYGKYTEAVKQGMTKENAILAVEKHKEFTNDDDKDNATQYATWVFNTYKSAKDRAIAGAIYTTKPVTIKDGRTYDENGYIYRDYTSAAWYKLSNRTLSSDGTNKRYEAAKKLVDTGLTAERIVEIYEGTTGLSKKSEWKEYLKSLKLTNEQIDIFMKSRWK